MASFALTHHWVLIPARYRCFIPCVHLTPSRYMEILLNLTQFPCEIMEHGIGAPSFHGIRNGTQDMHVKY